MKIHIRNPRSIDPASGLDAARDLFLAAGRVVGIGTAPDGFHANRSIDATGLVACPGLVDLSARLREPGFEYRATLASEMHAAVAGGVTSLSCPPDTDPPLDEPGLVEMLKYRARSLGLAKLYPVGALTMRLAGERLTEMAELTDSGCVAFTQVHDPIIDTQVLLRALQYAATFGYTVWLQPQDPYLARGGVAHEGEVSARLGLEGIPTCAETIRLAQLLQLARQTGVRLHLARLSSADGLEMVRQARADGLAVSCDIGIHHLHLCETDIGYFNPHCHLRPPLRARSDRDALRRGLAEGSIQALCSDHTPVDDDGKQLPFAESEAGASGLEMLLPLTLKWAMDDNVPLSCALARITCDAARILGVAAGRIEEGGAADLCLFDPEARVRISRESLHSQGKNSPFLGHELPGQVRYTLVDGHVVFEAARPHA